MCQNCVTNPFGTAAFAFPVLTTPGLGFAMEAPLQHELHNGSSDVGSPNGTGAADATWKGHTFHTLDMERKAKNRPKIGQKGCERNNQNGEGKKRKQKQNVNGLELVQQTSTDRTQTASLWLTVCTVCTVCSVWTALLRPSCKLSRAK